MYFNFMKGATKPSLTKSDDKSTKDIGMKTKD